MPFAPTTFSWLTLVSLAIAVAALVVAAAAWNRSGKLPTRLAPRPAKAVRRPKAAASQPFTEDQVTAEIETLQAAAAGALRHVAVVRYDAFADMGGHLSWSLALLDDSGDGVVLTSIHGRSDSRTYAKNIASWSANQQLSPEEVEAIGFGRAGDR